MSEEIGSSALKGSTPAERIQIHADRLNRQLATTELAQERAAGHAAALKSLQESASRLQNAANRSLASEADE